MVNDNQLTASIFTLISKVCRIGRIVLNDMHLICRTSITLISEVVAWDWFTNMKKPRHNVTFLGFCSVLSILKRVSPYILGCLCVCLTYVCHLITQKLLNGLGWNSWLMLSLVRGCFGQCFLPKYNLLLYFKYFFRCYLYKRLLPYIYVY